MGELRITGGRFRGRRLRGAPESRPTQERVREALFSRWLERLPGASVLDLFCGGGVVGLEALSRGAASAVFVDRSSAALRILAENCERLGIGRPEALRRDLARDLGGLLTDRGFDLVYVDPPYEGVDPGPLLRQVGRLLLPAGELALEHSRRRSTPGEAGELVRIDERRYGETGLAFYRRRAAAGRKDHG